MRWKSLSHVLAEYNHYRISDLEGCEKMNGFCDIEIKSIPQGLKAK
jgi:hypothetical protein